jgi:hypothetical protein
MNFNQPLLLRKDLGTPLYEFGITLDSGRKV